MVSATVWPVDGPKILYVCSAARCGSTILDMFLGGHPEAVSLGEINLIGKAIRLKQICTCGVELGLCPAWTEVFDALQGTSKVDLRVDPYEFALWPARARVLVDRQHQNWSFELAFKLRQAYFLARASLPHSIERHFPIPTSMALALENKLKLYSAVSGKWGCKVVIDSSKNSWEAVELARTWPDHVKVVLLSRDGRGVYHSRRNSGFSRRESIGGWLKYYGRAMPMLKSALTPRNLLQMRYEDFAGAPDSTGRELCDWLGIDFDPRMLNLESAGRHMVNGNDTRFNPQKGIRLDERWRHELVGEELNYFQRHGGQMNARLDYI